MRESRSLCERQLSNEYEILAPQSRFHNPGMSGRKRPARDLAWLNFLCRLKRVLAR